jgi:hypothetical protein
MQPVAGSHESTVQVLPSSQLIAVWTQPVAGSHESAVQAVLSSQLIGVKTQPIAGLQESAVQALLSLQFKGVPGMQIPLWHVSAPLQRSASAQLVPFGRSAYMQAPVAGLQTPTALHAGGAGHTTGVPACRRRSGMLPGYCRDWNQGRLFHRQRRACPTKSTPCAVVSQESIVQGLPSSYKGRQMQPPNVITLNWHRNRRRAVVWPAVDADTVNRMTYGPNRGKRIGTAAIEEAGSAHHS